MVASVYLCSFCDITLPSLENLLSNEFQAIAGKCLVYFLFVAFAKKNPSKKSVCVRVSTASNFFPPKPIRPKVLTFQPPTLTFYSSDNSFSSTNPYLVRPQQAINAIIFHNTI